VKFHRYPHLNPPFKKEVAYWPEDFKQKSLPPLAYSLLKREIQIPHRYCGPLPFEKGD
jgi:hypothetical protein